MAEGTINVHINRPAGDVQRRCPDPNQDVGIAYHEFLDVRELEHIG